MYIEVTSIARPHGEWASKQGFSHWCSSVSAEAESDVLRTVHDPRKWYDNMFCTQTSKHSHTRMISSFDAVHYQSNHQRNFLALKSHLKDVDLHLMSSLNYRVTSHSGGWWWEGLFETIITWFILCKQSLLRQKGVRLQEHGVECSAITRAWLNPCPMLGCTSV